jgi:hypothetical protein
MPVIGGYRIYVENHILCWIHPREVAEVMAAFQCVFDASMHSIDLL